MSVAVDSSFAEEEKGRNVCKEGQSKDKEEKAWDGESAGAWWVCRYVERLNLNSPASFHQIYEWAIHVRVVLVGIPFFKVVLILRINWRFRIYFYVTI